MKIENLASLGSASVLDTDIAIVGGGPAGLTIAREFIGTSTRVLVLESGLLEEAPEHAALNSLESDGEPRTAAQRQKRVAFHGQSTETWSDTAQPYGVRCRALGGSSHAWAGKSAAFDPVDFAQRPWVPHSSWPISRETLDSYLDRAADVLNLGPNVYDGRLWDMMGMAPPSPQFDADGLRPFFWQFARSRLDQLDIMRFGREFVTFKADNIRVLLNATVRQIRISEDGSRFEGLEIATIDGVRSQVKAKVAVVAAGGIENPRLLLASNAVHPRGIGNAHDLVGRFLMDHPSARVGYFEARNVKPIIDRFGFYGLRHGGRTHMYSHGLALTPAVQHSAISISSVKLAQLCMILAIDPVPMPPVWRTRFAIASSNGRARSKVVGSPPAITSRSRVPAPSIPPLTGASSIATSRSASSAWTRRTSAGALVVWSI